MDYRYPNGPLVLPLEAAVVAGTGFDPVTLAL